MAVTVTRQPPAVPWGKGTKVPFPQVRETIPQWLLGKQPCKGFSSFLGKGMKVRVREAALQGKGSCPTEGLLDSMAALEGSGLDLEPPADSAVHLVNCQKN